MFSFVKNLFDDNHQRLKSFRPIVAKINSLESECQDLTDSQLSNKTSQFKQLLSDGQSLDQILPEAFAVCREAIRRTIGERAYDVQLMAAIALHQGAIAEQRTGEGKTHSVIFAAYLNALTGQGVHVITPNDYLSRVGAGWYPRALLKLGLTVSCIVHEESFILDLSFTNPSETIDDRLAHLRPVSRREAYQADITYGTNNEFGFDYLRDHMVTSLNDKVQKNHFFAIVDEVDFVLIDEARTPLIISSPNNQPVDKYYTFAKIASQLQPNDYIIDEKARSATLSEFGIRKVEKILGVSNLYEESFETIHYIENAIKAQALYRKDREYVIKDNEVIIVDEFTGRLMSGRRWSDGLHQAVEAKENVPVQRESQTWATITFQNYFRLYQKLAGMTGTAATESEEFKKIYNLDVITIPTHLSVKRIDHDDLIYKTQRAKYAALAARVEELNKTGQPILIGTTSIDKNEIVSSLLRKKNIPHQILNAKNHRAEAEIIAKAGTRGAVTVATNMAGRGVDIVLGGPRDTTPNWSEKHQEIIDLGGLAVIGTERHESRRIDNQLRGRAGRQGDPGLSQFYVAFDDDLMRIFDNGKIQGLMTRFNMPEDEALTHPLVSKVLEQIQVKVEGYNFDIRKNLVEYDNVINKQRQIVYKLRDQTLDQADNDPTKNQAVVLEYLHKEIVTISQNPDIDTCLLEFNEILPMPDLVRQKVKKDLSSSDNPSELLSSLITQQWQQRVTFFGQDIANSIITYAIVSTLDPLWVEHLTHLDDLREGVRLRGYAQKDPLVEYRKEAYDMFQKLMSQFEYNLNRKLFRLEPVNQPPSQPTDISLSSPSTSNTTATAAKPSSDQSATLGRNDPCWCGSGKKWKKCHYPKTS